MSEESSPLIVDREGGIVRLRFNRPNVLNALDRSAARAFLDVCRTLAEDRSVRVLVLSGEGRAFMAGGDLAELKADPIGAAEALIGPVHEALPLLAGMRAPVVASLHGAVAGAGLSLAMACDFALAAEGTRFTLAYVNIGASCDVSASWSLPRLVGMRRALEIALLGDVFDAAEAQRIGIVNRVVPAAELQAQTLALARRLAEGPAESIAQMKWLMRTSFERDLRGQLDAEREAFLACAATADFAEGVDAFIAKRKPRFGGA
ncbi:MAG: enoyl-CoA hydratase/isomerase family protein [Burkholderiaceae bacterium]